MLIEIVLSSIEVGLITGLLAMGIFITFRLTNYPDLSCDGSIIIGATITAAFADAGLSPWIGLTLAACGGGMAGLFTAFLHCTLNIPNMFSGILTAVMSYSIGLHITQSRPIISMVDTIPLFDETNFFLWVPLILAGVLLFCGWVFTSRYGAFIQVAGDNPKLSEKFGINPLWTHFISLALSNSVLGMYGSLISTHQQFTDINQAIGSLLMGLGAVMLGEKILPVRNMIGRFISCIIGALLYRALISLAIQTSFLNLQPYDLNLVIGVVLILSMISFKKREGSAT